MFAWLKGGASRQQEQESAALAAMLTEFRREMDHIHDNWLPEVRKRYAEKVAGVWRD